MRGAILPRSFYGRETVEVARELLGKLLVHGPCAGMIIEVEAYLGVGDAAAHSAAGITSRTKAVFGPPGHAYVYLSYGIHECLNIVAEPAGTAGCVLIRALQPVEGLEIMRNRRPPGTKDCDLASGPGKLTRALAITREHYGADLTQGELTVRIPDFAPPISIEVTPRIGITKAVNLPLRFLLRQDEANGPRSSWLRTLRQWSAPQS